MKFPREHGLKSVMFWVAGGWECGLQNTLSPKDKALTWRCGQFSHQWLDMMEQLGLLRVLLGFSGEAESHVLGCRWLGVWPAEHAVSWGQGADLAVWPVLAPVAGHDGASGALECS